MTAHDDRAGGVKADGVRRPCVRRQKLLNSLWVADSLENPPVPDVGRSEFFLYQMWVRHFFSTISPHKYNRGQDS